LSRTVGFIQERRSEESLESLNKLVPHHCHIIRDGKQLHVLANEVVPGDLVTFATGDRIPADLRILSAADLEIDESSLTGETTTRKKDPAPCVEGTEMAERASIAYMGTLVRNGACFHASVGKYLTINHAQAVALASLLPPDPKPNLVSSLV
jgi:P-type Ca2+ transporter type 2C